MLGAKSIIAVVAIASAIVTGVVVIVVVVTLSVVLTRSSVKDTNAIYLSDVITNDPQMTNEMDTLEVISSSKFSGTKPKEWTMKYTKYPYWRCGLTFTNDEKQNIVNENKEYMTSLLQLINNGSLGRMPEKYGGDKQFEADGVNWEADRLEVRYGLFGRVFGQRAVAWAFPGEIVTIKFPKGMSYKGIQVSIGKCNHNPSDQWLNVNNWSNDRMPIDSIGFDLGLNTTEPYIINDTFKIGSPFGGMIYLRSDTTFTNSFYVTFSNVGRAPIINYNITTNEEWNSVLRNAPGNVAEIRTPGNRLVFTSRNIRSLEDAQYISDFWLKAISISNYAVTLENIPITLNFDQRVDAGAAVAYVGRWFTQNPSDWASGCVGKDGLINYGNWGPLHEMNHHMQGTFLRGGNWGINNPGEETNNVMTSINYILYTNIAGNRNQGLSGWNYVSDGYSTIYKILKGENDQPHLRSYVNMAHAFGTDTLIALVKSYYGLWYENNFESKYSIKRDSTSAFCLLAALVTKRDTRYLCSLFKYDIQSNVSEAIKNMNYPTYYPFFNLYAMSYNGNYYGRPYKIPYGKTRLNFTATTAIDPKATSVSYTIKSGLTKGKLEKVEDNVYDYTPFFGIEENDTFVLSIDCVVNGEKVHIEQEGTFELDPHQLVYEVYKDVQTRDMAQALNIIQNRTANDTGRASFFGIGTYNDGSMQSMLVEKGKFIVPKSGYYTLFMKADDLGRLLLNVTGEYEQLLDVKTYLGGYSKTLNGSYATVKLEKDIEYPFILYNLNTGGQGFIRIGYCYHGTEESSVDVSKCGVSDVGSSMVLNEKVKTGAKEREFQIPPIKYSRPTRFLTNAYRTIPKCLNGDDSCSIKCVSLPLKHDDTSKCSNMFDDNFSTMYHSRWTGQGTTFPVNYTFEFPENVTFNNLYVHHRRPEDSWGYFEMFVKSPETGEMELLEKYKHPKSTTTEIDFQKLVTTDRVQFIVYNNSNGGNYVNVVELSFNIKETFKNYTNSFGPKIKNTGFKKVTTPGASGGYLAVNEKEGEGSLCFKAKVTKFGLYGYRKTTSGKFRVTIDSQPGQVASQSYFSDSERTLFYAHTFDETEANKVHNICMEVVEGTVNLDIIGSS
ncbi:hypothetical protein ENUP19_0353G0031 [Entamoeba nuttalli]|uniref:Immuno-dominant variable surface antigen, putative n=2 Tax=Entamoeba nuttalli TaxID=412467 RepID=K2HNU5_ENTNP|nr:immuno-dominant variable surface antigen, putative [Entamoeba nuttalli P19]EKE37530.1 immuno-dominant variable surface antigen, putative [Entamoeba nuttalli P19]|eukprot:XP_008860134.1 immuno-dominant variable surface antigen, putative [Entamoeba nuttalli P19]